MLSTGDLTSLQRSAAMLSPGQSLPVARETLQELCTELLDARALLARLGADLRTVAAQGRGVVER